MHKFEFAGAAEEIAREAGALLREFYARGVETEYKGDVDLVTAADRASEALIRERLTAAFPTHGIYGEEGTRDQLESEYRWYVDPLDGTTNFAQAFRCFAWCSGWSTGRRGCGPEDDGQMIAGVIYDPLRDECFVAERGKGAWLNGKRDSCFDDAGAAGGADGYGVPEPEAAPVSERAFLPGVHAAVARGAKGGVGGDRHRVCSCRASGTFWEFNLNPWDTSAGYLLVEEAGGTVTHFDGGRFTLDSREVLATNGAIAEEMTALFADLFAGRNLESIPTPAEFAARRAAAATGQDR